jgi:hypothetical protein
MEMTKEEIKKLDERIAVLKKENDKFKKALQEIAQCQTEQENGYYEDTGAGMEYVPRYEWVPTHEAYIAQQALGIKKGKSNDNTDK